MTVYSKEKGFTKAPVVEGYARRPGRTPRVSVPPNYRGHAIVDGEERVLGVLEDTAPRRSDELLPSADTPTPRFGDLPRVSRLGESRHDRPPAYPNAYGGYAVPDYGEGSAPSRENEAADETYAPSDHPTGEGSPLPDHPAAPPPRRFGGILSLGLEEMLLLGLILFLLREGEECADRGDLDETVILLGLLLLLG